MTTPVLFERLYLENTYEITDIWRCLLSQPCIMKVENNFPHLHEIQPFHTGETFEKKPLHFGWVDSSSVNTRPNKEKIVHFERSLYFDFCKMNVLLSYMY